MESRAKMKTKKDQNSINKQNQEKIKRKTDIDLSIGLIEPLNFPYNFFIKLNDLLDIYDRDNKEYQNNNYQNNNYQDNNYQDNNYQDNNRAIRFYIYSFGQKRIVLWGFYLVDTQEFVLEGGCRYSTMQLHKMLNAWKPNNFLSSGYSVKDRIQETMKRYFEPEVTPKMTIDQYFDLKETYQLDPQLDSQMATKMELDRFLSAYREGSKTKIDNYNEYLELKYIYAYFNHSIEASEIEERFPDQSLLDKYYTIFLDANPDIPDFEIGSMIVPFLLDKLITYENSINLTQMSPDLTYNSNIDRSIKQMIQEINDQFYQFIKTGKFHSQSFIDNLQDCPHIYECESDDPSELCDVYHYGRERFA
jgi:hypothetical protein